MLEGKGFSRNAFQDDLGVMQNQFAEHINVQISHRAAWDVWSSFEKFLFGSGQMIHYQKRGTLKSIASKSPKNGMHYFPESNTFKWSGGKQKKIRQKGEQKK